MRLTGQRRETCHLLIGVLGAAFLLVSALACGSDADPGLQKSGEFQKVTVSDQVFTFDDLAAAGFKKQKEYNVEGLTAATGAWFGWWRPPEGGPVDCEVRFYASHEDAVEYGTPFAEEASGKDAVINSGEATWQEDVRDRRTIIGSITSDGGGSGPKYGDYAIFGNMVMLCEGADEGQSLERCEGLAKALVSVARE